MTISNSLLSGGSATYGGIYNDPLGTVTVDNSSNITGNGELQSGNDS